MSGNENLAHINSLPIDLTHETYDQLDSWFYIISAKHKDSTSKERGPGITLHTLYRQEMSGDRWLQASYLQGEIDNTGITRAHIELFDYERGFRTISLLSQTPRMILYPHGPGISVQKEHRYVNEALARDFTFELGGYAKDLGIDTDLISLEGSA